MPLTVNCPSCDEPLDVDDEYRSWMVRCPHCRHEFYPTNARVQDDRPRAPARRPQTRRGYGPPPDDDEVVYRAKATIAGPASWLRVVGGLSVVFGVLAGAGSVALAAMLANNPPGNRNAGPNQADVIANLVILAFASVMSVVVGVTMMYGAMKMGRLESHGWSMATAVLAISSVLYCTCALFTALPLGIWALVVLNRLEVREGFEVVARRRSGESNPDEDYDE